MMKKQCVGLRSFLCRHLAWCVMLAGILSLTAMSLSGFAQGKAPAVAKGTVVDQSGKPIAGVAVVIKGTSIGTATDAKGKYELELFDRKNVVLVYSMLGMKKQEIPYRNNTPIVVKMEEAAESVDEVVVTGYQKIDKRELSSSIVSIKGADLVGGAQMSLDRMLVGRLPGVAVSGLTSTPGAAPKIRIRGQSSITGNREPVWVLDGIILEEPVNISAEELNSPDYVNLIGNAIGSVNPEDIERVDILKDASATAIYGVKAANGVIVVTTKKGTKGAPQVNYTATLTVTSPPTYDKMFRMNSADRIDMSIEMQNRGLQFSTSTAMDVGYEGALQRLWNREIDYPEFLSQVNTLRTNNTDWYGELFRTAFSHQHSISVSGGNEKTDYYFSGGYANDRSVTIGEDVDRYTAMIKLNTQLAKNLKVGFKLAGSMSETDRPHTSIDMYEYAYNTSRAIPLYNPDGSLSFYTGGMGHKSAKLPYNIMNELEHGGYGSTNTNLSLNVNLDWDIAPWIKYSTVLGIARNQNEEDTWADDQSFYISQMRGLPYGSIVPLPDEDKDYADNYSLPYGGELINRNTSNNSYTWRNSLALFKNFGKHSLSANLGQEVRSSKYDGVKTTQYGYLPDRGKKFVDIDPIQWPAYAKLLRSHPDEITDTKDNVLSYYATATYSYDGRYIANFNIRTDGSNKFGQDPSVRFLPIWSVSGRWNIANEKFFEPLLGVFNDLSIRGSYGIQGNVHPDQTPNLITSLGSLDGMTQEYIATLSKYPNTKLRWEKTNSYNLAVDFALLNNRIYGSFDYYYKKGKDQVVQKTLAPSTGADYVAINEGDVENKGWDLAVSFVPVQTKNWTWHISFNTGKNYNKVLNAGEDQSITWSDFVDGSLVVNGSALNSFYSYRFNKLDSEGYPTFFGTEQKDGDNAIVHSQQEAFDRVFAYSGKRDPDLTGGISTYVRYKRFTFNCLFSFSFGNKVRLNDLYESAGQALPTPEQNMSSEFVGRWQKPGDENFTNIPVLSQNALEIKDKDVLYRYANNMWDMYNKSDLRVVSGNYLRCRSMSLRYDFDPKLLKKVYMKGASLSFDAGNVFVIKSKDLKGRDPEQLELGSRTVPPQRSYSLRLSITF